MDAPRNILRRMMLLAVLALVIAGSFFTQINNAQLKDAPANFPGIKFAVQYIALVFVIDPNSLIPPVIRIKAVKVIKEINFPPGATGQ
jgi:hypothetical protein